MNILPCICRVKKVFRYDIIPFDIIHHSCVKSDIRPPVKFFNADTSAKVHNFKHCLTRSMLLLIRNNEPQENDF